MLQELFLFFFKSNFVIASSKQSNELYFSIVYKKIFKCPFKRYLLRLRGIKSSPYLLGNKNTLRNGQIKNRNEAENITSPW